MHSWEVVAIELRDEVTEEPEDCTAISELGYLAPTLRVKDVDTVGKMMVQGHSQWHVEVDGEERALEPVKRNTKHYCRILDEDSPDDPLLALPTVPEWEQGERLDRLG